MPSQTPLQIAEAMPLMGQTSSWDFNGGKPLGVVPDKVLRQARRWFTQKVRESHGQSAGALAMREQIRCIDLVMQDREANNPQQSLALT